MNSSPITTAKRYHLERVAKVALIVGLLLMVRPAFALFSGPADDEDTIVVTATNESPEERSSTFASAASTGLDELFAVNKNVPPIDITAGLVKELGAPEPMLVYRASARWPLASLTKLMTSVVALDTLGASTIITVPQEAVDVEGTAGDLKAGDRYTVIDLIRAMLTVSSNDAAATLAHAYDKKQLGQEAYDQAINKMALFTVAMQDKARSLGMSQTYFGDPTGLSVINQSVLTDLSTLVSYIADQYPQLFEITTNRQNSILERKSMTRRTLTNINEFAGKSDFIGGKTGLTDEAGGNLISLFSYEGRKYLIIVLGTENRFEETRKLYEWVKETNHVITF